MLVEALPDRYFLLIYNYQMIRLILGRMKLWINFMKEYRKQISKTNK